MEEYKIKKGRKGQITIFVIVAIIIIAGVALVFMLKEPSGGQEEVATSSNPTATIVKCAEDAFTDAEALLIPQGGFMDDKIMEGDYLFYEESKVVWMCYTGENEVLCSNRHPMLNKEIEKGIYDYVKPKLDKCFADIKNDFSGYDYSESSLDLVVNIIPRRALIIINKNITVEKNGQRYYFDNFDVSLASPLYDFISISSDILREETLCECGEETCNADIIKLNMDNRKYEITRFVTGRNEKIYSIKEIISGKQFNFALRNCVRMP